MEMGESKRRSNSYEVVISQMTIRVLVSMCVCVYACEWYSVLIFINHGQSFDNPSSSSSSVPDDSPDDRNGVDFNWSLVGTIPRHLPHAPLFKSPDKIYILPQRTHSSCGSPAQKKNEKEKTELCRYNHRFEYIESHSCMEKEKKKPTTHATEIDSTQKSCRHIICARLKCMERKQRFQTISPIEYRICALHFTQMKTFQYTLNWMHPKHQTPRCLHNSCK